MEDANDSDSDHSHNMEALNGLTEEQRENVLHFQEISGINEIEHCRQALEENNWNIEAAVHSQVLGEHHPIGGRQTGDTDAAAAAQLQDSFGAGGAGHLDDGGGLLAGLRHRFAGGQGAGVAHAGVQYQLMDSSDDEADYPAPRQRVIRVPPSSAVAPIGWFGWAGQFLLMPIRLIYSTVWDLFRFVLSIVRPDPRRYVTDAEGDVRRFITSFEESYGIAPRPNFLQCSYNTALQRAKQELKFLLVYLHGDSHEDTPQFCRRTLCDGETSEYLNTNMLVWGCNINSPEGFRVSQALKEHSYPFLGLTVLGRNNRMTLVARLVGPIQAQDLRARLTELMAEHEHVLVSARAEREERLLNQNLRAEQDRAYEESLRADEEKERRRMEVEEARRRQEEELQASIEAEEARIAALTAEKERCRELLSPEPDATVNSAITLRIRLPSGKSLVRRFNAEHSVKHLYYFLLCHEDAPDDFTVKTMMPSKPVPCRPENDVDADPPSFLACGLTQSQTVIVQDNTA